MKKFVKSKKIPYLYRMEKCHQRPRVAFHTLGCRLNFAETGEVLEGFRHRNYEIVPFGHPAEVTFINTCTVTDRADSSCRRLIRQAHRINPEGKIIVSGCYAQMEADKVSKMEGVDLVVGTSQKNNIFRFLKEEKKETVYIDKSTDFFAAAAGIEGGRTSAFLKIQDGCNYVCSFCIIPQARGRSKALPIKDIVSQAQKLVAKGLKEIVLTGVNIGEYEKSSGEKLSDLIKELGKIERLERLRLSSLEPNTLNDELFDALEESPQFMNYFHIPLQSGDDDILGKMRRKYGVRDYTSVINKIKNRFSNAGIGADVICGFPGETNRQFENTYNLLEELDITHFHVFPFSKRKNTVAAKMENNIQYSVKKKRAEKLRRLGEKRLSLFSSQQLGKPHSVLFEHKNRAGDWEGYTPNFIRVAVSHGSSLKNKVVSILPTSLKDGRPYAQLI